MGTAAAEQPGLDDDLQQVEGTEAAPRKASRQILKHEIEEGQLPRRVVALLKYGHARPEAQTT